MDSFELEKSKQSANTQNAVRTGFFVSNKLAVFVCALVAAVFAG